jgi:hypothetical protein
MVYIFYDVFGVFFIACIFFNENGYVSLGSVLVSQNQKVTYLKKAGDL